MADHPLPKGGIFRLHQSNTTGTAGKDWLCRVKHTKDDSCFALHEWHLIVRPKIISWELIPQHTAFQTWEKELTTNHQVLLSILLSTLHHLKEITILDFHKEESSNLGKPNQTKKPKSQRLPPGSPPCGIRLLAQQLYQHHCQHPVKIC